MKKYLIISAIVVSAAFFAVPASADGDGFYCNKAPSASPMALSSFFLKLENEGYQVREFDYEHNCYKIEGYDTAKRRIKAYFSDIDGSLIHTRPDF
ncbi:MAG: PepSY domain-containing protein [Burkholderiales bacterium]|jgi:hypothetical protein|nr:PepSY domain-containing protein [Burkholderiales bacterium]